MQSSTFVCSAKSEVGVAMDCPTTSAAVKPDFQVMSAQAGASADAPLQNGVDAGTSRVREEEAETGSSWLWSSVVHWIGTRARGQSRRRTERRGRGYGAGLASGSYLEWRRRQK